MNFPHLLPHGWVIDGDPTQVEYLVLHHEVCGWLWRLPRDGTKRPR